MLQNEEWVWKHYFAGIWLSVTDYEHHYLSWHRPSEDTLSAEITPSNPQERGEKILSTVQNLMD